MTREEVEAKLASIKNKHYVYHLLKPDGTPFYVGKGRGKRVLSHEREALGPGLSRKLNTIRLIVNKKKQNIGYNIVAEFDDETKCHKYEIAEIARLGRRDLRTGPLTNLTSGGEGASGMSEETMQRIHRDLRTDDAPGERGIANRFFHELNRQTTSVPIRPVSLHKPIALVPHRAPKDRTPRMFSALAASAIANRVLLEPGCVIPRRMIVEGKELVIENGSGASIIEGGIATLLPGQPAGREKFVMSGESVNQLLASVNKELLIDAGILMPTE
jgi:hypothetical protein